MNILRFNEQQLVTKLEQLSESFRAIFASACAERLLPAYTQFSQRTGRGNPSKLVSILDHLWSDLEGDKMSAEQMQENIDLCMSLIPQESEGTWVLEQASAEDAAAALAYALRCRQSGEAQEAAWAARRAYEALDHFVINQKRIDINMIGGEGRVLSHPLIQAELARQRRDLEELLAGGNANTSTLIARIRRRAKAEAKAIFRLAS